MARAYETAQTAAPGGVEVVWQRRPQARRIPVRLVRPALVEVPRRPVATQELAWVPREASPNKED